MFGWIKRLFGIGDELELRIADAVQAELNNEVEVEQQPVEEAKPKKVAKKKKQPKKDTPDFESMTKAQLEAWAKEHIGIDVDRRRKKDFIIETIKTKLKEK